MKALFTLALASILPAVLIAQNFSAPYFVTSSPNELTRTAIADFDGDGDMDIVSSGYNGILASNREGFAYYDNQGGVLTRINNRVSTAVDGSYTILPVDLNNDGTIDILCSDNNKLYWYLNVNNTSFQGPITISNITGIYGVAAGELNGVPGIDIVIAVLNNDLVRAYFNNGNGGFPSFVNVSTSSIDAIDVKVADLDGDGLNDVLVANLNVMDVSWHRNLGNNNYGTAQVLTTGMIGTYGLDYGDFDNDGDLDIVAVGFGTDDLSYFENLGTVIVNPENPAGTIFGPRQVISTSIDGAQVLKVADFNNDGMLDVVAGGNFVFDLFFFTGNGNGTFISTTLNGGSVRYVQHINAADLNGDGLTDIVSSSRDDAKLAWYPQQVEGSESDFAAQILINKSASSVNKVISSDLNGDGYTDLVSASRTDGKIAWYRNNLNQGFFEQEVIYNTGAGAVGLEVGLINGDALPDLVISSGNTSSVVVLFNAGDGLFSPPVVIDSNILQPLGAAIADLNNDGHNDVIIPANGEFSVLIYYNNGNGSFQPEATLCSGCGGVLKIAAADLNGDGLPEVVIGNGFNQAFSVFRNLDGNNFGPEETIISGVNGCRAILFLDFDQDGDLDIFGAGIFDQKVNYVLNQGNLNFSSSAEVPFFFAGPHDLAAIDFNNDGETDIAVVDFFNNRINAIKIENGQFVSRVNLTDIYEQPNQIAVGDFNGDSKDDFAISFVNSIAAWNNISGACSQTAATNLLASVGTTNITFTWSPIPGAIGCRVSGNSLAGGPVLSQDVVGNQVSSLTIPKNLLNPSATYQWRVRCACSNNPLVPNQWSAFAQFSINAGMQVYPNPVSDEISIVLTEDLMQLTSDLNTQVRIVDMAGRLVYSGQYQGAIPANNLPNGVYMLELSNGSERQFAKFMKH